MLARTSCTSLDEHYAKTLLNNHDTFLFDCDGVLWNLPDTFPRAIELLNYLKEEGKRVFFVTNNSTKTQDDYVKILRGFNYDAKPEQVICTAWLTAQYLKGKNFEGKCYVVGMQSMRHELSKEGFEICGGIGPDPITSEAGTIHNNKIDLDKDVNCVISALDRHISYLKILKAATYLNRPNVLFIATNDDASLPQNDEIIMPGAGSILASIATASCRTPTILGKPHSAMFDMIRQAFPDVNPTRTVMIGDRVETDISFGNRQGLTTLLVFSGATSESYLKTLQEEVENKTAEAELLPNFCVKNVAELLQLMQNN